MQIGTLRSQQPIIQRIDISKIAQISGKRPEIIDDISARIQSGRLDAAPILLKTVELFIAKIQLEVNQDARGSFLDHFGSLFREKISDRDFGKINKFFLAELENDLVLKEKIKLICSYGDAGKREIPNSSFFTKEKDPEKFYGVLALNLVEDIRTAVAQQKPQNEMPERISKVVTSQEPVADEMLRQRSGEQVFEKSQKICPPVPLIEDGLVVSKGGLKYIYYTSRDSLTDYGYTDEEQEIETHSAIKCATMNCLFREYKMIHAHVTAGASRCDTEAVKNLPVCLQKIPEDDQYYGKRFVSFQEYIDLLWAGHALEIKAYLTWLQRNS